MKNKFNPEPIKCYGWGGAGSGPLNPGREAEDIGLPFHGAWLCAYMIRRFGPPNHPSDDHKNLCSWTITTPMRGLALLVTPYLADEGKISEDRMSLHFGYRHSKSVRKAIDKATIKHRRLDEMEDKVARWQHRKYVGIYLKDAEDREIIWQTTPEWHKGDASKCMAICKAKPQEDRRAYITLAEFRKWSMNIYWPLLKEYEKAHPFKPRKVPANGRWPQPAFCRRCNLALRASIKALLQPITVRNITFSVSGLLQDGEYQGKLAQRFAKAGWACKVDDGRK